MMFPASEQGVGASYAKRFAGLRIDLKAEDDLARWCHIFDCTEAELRCAIRSVGVDAAEVCVFVEYLQRGDTSGR